MKVPEYSAIRQIGNNTGHARRETKCHTSEAASTDTVPTHDGAAIAYWQKLVTQSMLIGEHTVFESVDIDTEHAWNKNEMGATSGTYRFPEQKFPILRTVIFLNIQ